MLENLFFIQFTRNNITYYFKLTHYEGGSDL